MLTPNSAVANVAKRKRARTQKSSPEAEFAARVIAWLEEQGWDCYQEVTYGEGSPCADIVAVREGWSMVVETKKNAGFEVIGQANYWRCRANWACFATPYCKRSYSASGAINDFAHYRGLGWIEENKAKDLMDFTVPPRFFRVPSALNVKSILRPEHKHYAKAGTKEGGRFTPYQRTCRAILAEVSQTPGITIGELMGRIEHHYGTDKTAKNCIAKWGQAGAIRGVRAVKRDRVIKFYLA